MSDEPRIPVEVLRCPTHGIPDCSPLLNGCSIPRQQAQAYLQRREDARTETTERPPPLTL